MVRGVRKSHLYTTIMIDVTSTLHKFRKVSNVPNVPLVPSVVSADGGKWVETTPFAPSVTFRDTDCNVRVTVRYNLTLS